MTKMSTFEETTAVTEFRVEDQRWWERRVTAIAITVLLYATLVVVLGGRAHLGGDTGGRAAVLAAVDTGEHGHYDVG